MPLITIWVPKDEIETWKKHKGDRTWREIAEDGLFGEHRPNDLVSYDEMVSFIELKIAEALAKQK